MKRIKRIKAVITGLFISAVLWGCGLQAHESADTAQPSSESEKTLYDRGLEIIGLMSEMTRSDDYRNMISGSDEIRNLIRSIGEESFEDPSAAYAVTIEDDSLKEIMKMAGMTDTMSEELKEFMRHRITASVISYINASGGVESLAAVNACTAEKSFADDSISDDVIYIYTFEAAEPAAVAFRTGEDHTVSATGTFIISDDFEYGSEEEIKASFLKAGIDVNVEELKEASDQAGSEKDSPENEKAAKDTSDSKELFPYINVKNLSEYADVGQLLASVRYETPAIHSEAKAYSELKSSLEAYSKDGEAAAEAEYKNILESAKADKELSETFSGYSIENDVEILRADERVFSFLNEKYTYTGGAHGFGDTTGVSFDTHTGKRLDISEVISDRSRLSDYIADDLKKRYGENGFLFEGWEETVRNEPDINFAMADDCIKIYYSPDLIGPNALGTVTVDVPYEETSIGFNDRYLPVRERSVWSISPYEELSLDIDGDGNFESIRYELSDNNGFETGYTVFISGEGGEKTAGGSCYYGICDAYIMKSPGGKYMFYAEYSSDNDWRYLTIQDLTALYNGENQGSVEPSGYYEAFYGNVPASSEDFYLETRGDLISTVNVRKEYRLGEDGMPEALGESYIFDDFSLTARRDITGEAIGKSGEQKETKINIPAGTRLNAVSTDEKEYAVFEIADTGELVSFHINADTWPHTIAGTDIADLFDGLVFAG